MATELPEDIIENNILIRLPIKSLIRFTCVSKRWRFIILHTRKFAKSQLQYASQHKSTTHRMLVCSLGPCFHEYLPIVSSLDMDSPWSGNDSCARTLDFRFQRQPIRKCEFLGSANGLVFVALEHNRFYIWNPTTRLFKRLPDIVQAEKEGSTMDLYGAGYLSATNNYKILVGYTGQEDLLELDDDELQEYYNDVIHIFSVRDYNWRRIRVDNIRPMFNGTLVNGALHWLDGSDKELVAFDFATEEFRMMDLPESDHVAAKGTWRHLEVVGGCLCIQCTEMFTAPDHIDFWVMTEYGVRDSWTKLFSVNFSHLHSHLLFKGTSHNPAFPYLYRWIFTESSTVGIKWLGDDLWFIRIDKEKEKHELLHVFKIKGGGFSKVKYEESLAWFEVDRRVIEHQKRLKSRQP